LARTLSYPLVCRDKRTARDVRCGSIPCLSFDIGRSADFTAARIVPHMLANSPAHSQIPHVALRFRRDLFKQFDIVVEHALRGPFDKAVA
jgi:hypothetical protein